MIWCWKGRRGSPILCLVRLQRLNMGNGNMCSFPKTKHVYPKKENIWKIWNVNSQRIQLKIIGRLDLFGVACTALAGVGREGGGSINHLWIPPIPPDPAPAKWQADCRHKHISSWSWEGRWGINFMVTCHLLLHLLLLPSPPPSPRCDCNCQGEMGDLTYSSSSRGQ